MPNWNSGIHTQHTGEYARKDTPSRTTRTNTPNEPNEHHAHIIVYAAYDDGLSFERLFWCVCCGFSFFVCFAKRARASASPRVVFNPTASKYSACLLSVHELEGSVTPETTATATASTTTGTFWERKIRFTSHTTTKPHKVDVSCMRAHVVRVECTRARVRSPLIATSPAEKLVTLAQCVKSSRGTLSRAKTAVQTPAAHGLGTECPRCTCALHWGGALNVHILANVHNVRSFKKKKKKRIRVNDRFCDSHILIICINKFEYNTKPHVDVWRAWCNVLSYQIEQQQHYTKCSFFFFKMIITPNHNIHINWRLCTLRHSSET